MNFLPMTYFSSVSHYNTAAVILMSLPIPGENGQNMADYKKFFWKFIFSELQLIMW